MKRGRAKHRYLSKPWQQFQMMCGAEIGIMISHCLVSLLKGYCPDLKLNLKRKTVYESQVWQVLYGNGSYSHKHVGGQS